MNKFLDKIAIVAGGASGIGKAVQVDVSNPSEIESLINNTASEYGRIDYLFNNAGISVNGEFQDISLEKWKEIFDVNLWGVIYGCRYAYPVMIKQGYGHIINTASLGGLIPGGLTTTYSASKHAVVGFSLTLRSEARLYGIKVSALCPGYLRTNIQETTPNVSDFMNSEKNKKMNAAMKFLTPEDCINQIMRGVRRNRGIIVTPVKHKIYWWLHRLSPEFMPNFFVRIIRYMKKNINIFLAGLLLTGLMLTSSCNERPEPNQPADFPDEIIYHVFQRSFYDSNGDGIGDLAGLNEKLDYLQELGVTSILMLPLYNSVFYHNYFPIDFETIDPEFGTKEDYFNLVRNVHRRGMKIYMDMEVQYITEDHLWYKDSYKNPSSAYSDYLIYNGPGNTQPEPIVWDLIELLSYDGTVKKVTTLNLLGKKYQNYIHDLFKYWVDPNKDGNFEDGVDGFRIDHMMSDLDWKGKITGLFSALWKPLFDELRTINPEIKILGEQANWGADYGNEYYEQGGIDMVFAFGLNFAIRDFNKREIINKYDSTLLFTPEGKYQILFIENHDMQRFASATDNNAGKMRIGAAFNLLLKGVPSIYYGQELGMTGNIGSFDMSDGNHIPVREAFEWYRTVEGKGMALWYKDTGPWWDQTNLKDNDGISLEEEKTDPGSLWYFYSSIIRLRRLNPAISKGDFRFIDNSNDHVITFLRWDASQKILVALNLSGEDQETDLPSEELPGNSRPRKLLFGTVTQDHPVFRKNEVQLKLDPYGIRVWLLK